MGDNNTAQKTTYFINNKGRFFTRVNEMYLREDISTGWDGSEHDEDKKCRLLAHPAFLKLADDDVSRYLFFFDRETLLSQLDLIENCDKLRNIVLLQSSIETTKLKYSPLN